MEEFQKSYLSAVAAAAGCIIASFEIDDGVDAQLNHHSAAHTALSDETARLEIQLKATHRDPPKRGGVSVAMRQDRFNYYRTDNPTMSKIVVVMHLPKDQEGWILASHDRLSIHHCAYWVNLAGAPTPNAGYPTVSAPSENIFDDKALCAIMVRIGQGGAP